MVKLSYLYVTTRKTIALIRQTFFSKVIFLLFNTQSLSFSQLFLQGITSWLQSPSAVILEFKKINCQCFHFFPIYLPWSDGTECHDLSFLNVEFQASFFILLFHSHQEALSSSLLSDIRVVSSREWCTRGWDSWMTSMIQWKWVWANTRRWWKTGKFDMLQSSRGHKELDKT